MATVTDESAKIVSRPAKDVLILRLVIEDDQLRDERYSLDGRDTFAIGQDRDCDIIVHDKRVSRRHAILTKRGDGWWIQDHDSKNGLFINGRKTKGGQVPPDGLITLGHSHFVVTRSSRVHDLELPPHIVAVALATRTAFARLKRIAGLTSTVLLGGETGTGKEEAARFIHAASARADQPFVVVDCGSISPNLFEEHLFGHERGAYTGAGVTREGAFESAAGGTVFLDEIGELPLDLQPKLLRVLDRKEVQRLGTVQYRAVDVRVVAATNRNLEDEVKRGRFREDLYQRLAGETVELPPLRERRDDIPALIQKLLGQHSPWGKTPSRWIESRDVFAWLAYDWPGNVRELKNVLASVAGLVPEQVRERGFMDELIGRTLSYSVENDAPKSEANAESPDSVEKRARGVPTLDELAAAFGELKKISHVAKRFGVKRQTVYYWCKKRGFDPAECSAQD